MPDEVIVIVREEDAETRRLLDANRFGKLNVNVATIHEPGLVAALNRGLEAATCDVVAFTDDDTVPRPDWLERIERHFAADPCLGGLGGRDWLHPPSGEVDQLTVGKVRWYGRMVGNHHRGVGSSRPVDVLKGANMSFRRRALGKSRLDELLEDQERRFIGRSICVSRSNSRGGNLYDPAVSVDHYPAERFEDDSRSGPVTGKTLEDVIHNETYLLLTWLPWWRRVAALLYWLLVGTRNAPGLLLLIERLVRASDRRSTLRRYVASVNGRRAGVRSFRRAR